MGEKKGNRAFAPFARDVNWMPKPPLSVFVFVFGLGTWDLGWKKEKFTSLMKPEEVNTVKDSLGSGQSVITHTGPRTHCELLTARVNCIKICTVRWKHFPGSSALHLLISSPPNPPPPVPMFFWLLTCPGPYVVSAGWNFQHDGITALSPASRCHHHNHLLQAAGSGNQRAGLWPQQRMMAWLTQGECVIDWRW